MFQMFKKTAIAVLSVTLLASAASAAPIVPQYDVFGALPAATFGGTGIPNNAVAVSTYQPPNGSRSSMVTMGLTAHARYDNLAVTNNNMGTFFAAPGPDASTVPQNNPAYATWNFAFYIDTVAAGPYNFQLLYDFDPATGNDQATHGQVLFSGVSSPFNYQNSWNLGMPFLDGVPPLVGVTPPSPFGAFNPNNAGQHTFAILLFDAAGSPLDRVAINVVTGQATVPEPASLGLIGLGLVFTAHRMRRRL